GRRSTLPVSVGNAEVDVLEELAHLLRVLAENPTCQSGLGLVRLLKRFVKGLEFVDGDERHEQFLLHQPMIRRKTSHNCRCNIVSFGQLSLRSFSTRQNLAAVFFGLLDRSLILLERLIINYWADEGRFLSGISNDDLVNLRLEDLQKVFSDAPLHIDPRRRAALLTSIAVGSLHDSFSSLLQVSFRGNYCRVLASHLGNERLRIRLLGDKIPVELHSNILRSSKRNPSNQRVAREFSSEGTAGTRDVVNDAGGDSGLDKNLVQLQRGKRRLTCWLENHRVAGDQRSADHAPCQRKGKVERTYHSPDTMRAQHTLTVLARYNSIHRCNVSVILLHDPSIVPAHVSAFLDL